jgi:threonyl-tRNA synthetase
MRVPLPDGSVRELPDGSTGADLAADIGPGLARAAMAIRVLDGDKTEKRDGTAYDNGRIVDLSQPLTDGQPVEIVTAKAGDGDALKLLRHDVAHVLAESVLELYPGTKVSIGPPIADGFYYDFYPGTRSRSARRSPTASTTTSSSRTASRSTRTTSRRSKPR